MDKRFWTIIGVIIIVFAGILTFHSNKSGNGSSSSSAKPTNHVIGNTNSKVTLVEYGDYECPVCENYYAAVQQVQQKYNDTVKFQFRNLPLLQIHPNAFAGARAAEAAGLQGKYWQMHDLLYTPENWQEWSTSSNTMPYFKSYAAQLGLNAAKFQKDFASDAVNNSINADITAFKATGQSEATPTFFVNGKYVSNAQLVDASGQPSLDAFSAVLDAALKNAK